MLRDLVAKLGPRALVPGLPDAHSLLELAEAVTGDKDRPRGQGRSQQAAAGGRVGDRVQGSGRPQGGAGHSAARQGPGENIQNCQSCVRS